MRTIEEHSRQIGALVDSALAGRSSHRVELAETGLARGVLAADVVSGIDLPPFDNSQMDGYAVASADLAEGAAALRVAARIPAGHAPGSLARGTAAPIMTGAPIPDGADAVVQIERADPASFLPEGPGHVVTLPGPIAPGTFVRRSGSDLPRGRVLFPQGTSLGAPQWGSLVAAGVDSVLVVDRPRILLVSTGEELAAAGRPLEPATIYDANGASMSAALTEAGAEVVLERVGDDPEALLAVVRRHAGVDLIVTTGGVSEGAYEVVRETFGPRGVTFGAVAMQPGGPQGWGSLAVDDASVPVVCFPGNPVSALISFEAFLRAPLLRAGVGRCLGASRRRSWPREPTHRPASTRSGAGASTRPAAPASSAGRARTCCTRTRWPRTSSTSRSESAGSKRATRS
ncbi:putative molybdopterin biosynthesis protein MoeA [Frondihabitans sucicola]|uniref:Molybdopterin molybdenumtransferase n=1 Tax=Frondihabitans sucicola TaxID=1268041 RepID=A0ABM8GMH7_9MICO|nr:putative molybdopterin biosynthesis protein MoeA [Frondihabitans sucicola]